MLLAIDCGNTNTVFALYKTPHIKTDPVIWRCETNARRSADEYTAWLLPLLELEGVTLTDIQTIWVASVVPDVNAALKRMADKHITHATMHCVKPDASNSGLKIDMPVPVKIGADQIVNARAAIAHYGTPAIVIDFGTATTFDVVNNQGAFVGGVIAPGVNLSLQAMHDAAALLPRVSIEKPGHVIGQNTIHAMQSGLYWGYVAMIEGLLDRVKADLSGDPVVIATGGLSSLFCDAIDGIDHADPVLTLEGLRLIACDQADVSAIQSAA